MIQVVIIILFIIFLIYSIRCLNKSETYTINKLYISWENKDYIEEVVTKWILVLVNPNGEVLHEIENTDVENRKNFNPVKITFIDNKDFDGKIFGDNILKVYYNKKIDSNLVITTNIRFDGTDFSAKLSDIEYADVNFPDKFIDPKINTARFVWYGMDGSSGIRAFRDKIIPIQTIAVYSDGVNITKNLNNNSIHGGVQSFYNGSQGDIRKVFKDSSARGNGTGDYWRKRNTTWIKSTPDYFYGAGTYTAWILIDLGKEYPIDKVVVDRDERESLQVNTGPGTDRDHLWEDTFVKLQNSQMIEVSRSIDKVPSGEQAINYKEEGLKKGIKTFTFPHKTAKVDCMGFGTPWSACNKTCGNSGTQYRTFKMSAPARNGGSCPNLYEAIPCNRKLCDFRCEGAWNCPEVGFRYITEKWIREIGDELGDYLIPSGLMTTSALVELRRKIIAGVEGSTKTGINDFQSIDKATNGKFKRKEMSRTTHYWITKFVPRPNIIDNRARSWDSVTGDFSITIETGNDAHIGWILVNDQLIGKPSSKGKLGGGEFKLTSWEVAKIEIFLFDKSGEVDGFDLEDDISTNSNMMQVLFKAPVNDSHTHIFSEFRDGRHHTSNPGPFFPPVSSSGNGSLCDRIDKEEWEDDFEDCERMMEDEWDREWLLRNDNRNFNQWFGHAFKENPTFEWI